MKVIGVQLDIAWEDKRANCEKVSALLGDAEIEAGSLVVLPEMFSTGFSMKVDKVADGAAREVETFLATLAQEHQAYLLGGVANAGPNTLGRNEAVVFDPSGSEIARYCKIHPFSYVGETKHYESGEQIVTFSCGDFTVAPFICYDLRFPEIFRKAVKAGANLFPVIANWPEVRTPHWKALLPARAIENQAYVIGVNRCGSDPKVSYSGDSVIISPQGESLVTAGDGERIISAELDLAVLEEYRRRFPALADMRSDTFEP